MNHTIILFINYNIIVIVMYFIYFVNVNGIVNAGINVNVDVNEFINYVRFDWYFMIIQYVVIVIDGIMVKFGINFD